MLRKKKKEESLLWTSVHFVEQEDFRCLAHQGQIYSGVRVYECECVGWVRVCNNLCVCAFQNSPIPLYSAWNDFHELPLLVTGLGQIKAMPLLSALSCYPCQAAAFLSTLNLTLLHLTAVDPLFSPSLSRSTRVLKLHPDRPASDDVLVTWTLKSDSWGSAARQIYWRLYCFVYLLLDGWMACVNCCLYFAAPVFCTQGCQELTQTHDVHQMGFFSLWAFIWALVLWIPPFQPSSLFIVPSLFLTVDALDVLMLFILKWQSILHCCCFLI